MSTRQQRRPVSSYLLRVHEEQTLRVVRRYELVDLASGTVLRFATLAALQRHLREAENAEAAGRTQPLP
jgi:hypothetical protein